MKGLRRSLVAASAILALVLTTSTVYAAHESNSRAELVPIAGWTASAAIDGFAANTTYNVVINLNGADPQVLCTFTTGATGSGGCSDRRDQLAGFNRVEIVEASTGTVVANGVFVRRGGGRERP